MSYSTLGLKCQVNSAGVSEWALFTVDDLATATGSGYVTDAGPANSGKGAPGRGIKLFDKVTIYSGVDSATAPTSVTKVTPAYVSALSSSTGAATLAVVALS